MLSSYEKRVRSCQEFSRSLNAVTSSYISKFTLFVDELSCKMFSVRLQRGSYCMSVDVFGKLI